MIQLSTEKQLSILLPNSNKALAEVLKNATSEQFQTLVKEKDIRTIVTGLLNETVQNAKADRIVLELLKNAPIFKNMGSVTGDLKQLIENLPKSEGKLKTIQTALQQFVKSMEKMDPALLQKQVNNSGVFLESKLAAAIEPKSEIKQLLNTLQTLLRQSDQPAVKKVLIDIKGLLSNEALFQKEATLSAKPIAQAVEKIVQQVSRMIQQSDPVRSAEVAKIVDKLAPFIRAEALVQPHSSDVKLLVPRQLQGLLIELKQELIRSPMPEIKTVLQQLEKLTDNVSKLPQMPIPQTVVPKTVVPTMAQPMQQLVTQLQNILQTQPMDLPKSLPPVVKELEQMVQTLASKPEPNLFSSVEKLLNTLLGILDTLESVPTKPLITQIESLLLQRPVVVKEQLVQLNVPQDLQTIVQQLTTLQHQGDTLFSKELSTLIEKLVPYTKAERMIPEAVMKESLAHDVKALLLQLNDEVQKSAVPHAQELLRQSDKVMMQIDYYQLLSHLSSSTALYLPFVWDSLEQGSLAFKKSKEKEQFFCEINLQLKEYGELNLMLALYDKNQLNIRAYTEKRLLKERLTDALPQLRAALVGVDIMPRQIRIFEKEEQEKAPLYAKGGDDIDLGFEVKV